MKGFTKALVLGLATLSCGYPTRQPSFPKFEPSRPPPRVTAEPGSTPNLPFPVWSEWSHPCLSHPETHAYITKLREAIFSQWHQESTPGGVAYVRLVLATGGEAQSLTLDEESHTGVGQAALKAVAAADPFPPLPAGANCLAGMPLRIQFVVESYPE